MSKTAALHGGFGWSYSSWAGPEHSRDERAHLSHLAARSIRGILANWQYLKREDPEARPKAHALGWMQTRDYLELAARSLEDKVLAPLRKHGIDPLPYLGGELPPLAPPAGATPNDDVVVS